MAADLFGEFLCEENLVWLKDAFVGALVEAKELANPIFKVPVELSLILFIAVNIYKSVYVIYDTARPWRVYLTGLSIVALTIEKVLSLEKTINNPLWYDITICTLIPLPMLLHKAIAAALVCIFISYSKVLSFCLDVIFIVILHIKALVIIPSKFRIYTIAYLYFCCGIHNVSLAYLLPYYDTTLVYQYIFVLYVALTGFFMQMQMSSDPWYLRPYFRLELVIYLMFPTMLDSLWMFAFEEEPTYTVPYLKSVFNG